MSAQLSRRRFLGGTAAAGSAVFLSSFVGGRRVVVAVPVAAATLPAAEIPQFTTPLLIPPVMPRAGTARARSGKPIDRYEISVRQIAQQILPEGFPATTVWGYGAIASARRDGLLVHHAPSLTIEARWRRPVQVTWINDLVDDQRRFLPHLLPVDPTLHWANPPGGLAGRDGRPTFSTTPGPYTGPVPLVTHVHGAVGVADDSDGYTEAWYLPDAVNLPAGYAREGTWYDFFRAKAEAAYGVPWGPGFAVFQYPNENRASTIWYHDHALGMTRLNVYAGPAGFYLIRGGPAGDEAVLDDRFRRPVPAVLPGPAPREGDPFPSNRPYYEIPIAIQDRTFTPEGALSYPDTRAIFDGFTGPFMPESNVSPIWNPEFFGNTIMVNGSTWPYLTVEQRRYRLRFLNGCQSRFVVLDFAGIPDVEVWQIGNEGGFLPAPVNLTADHDNRLLLGLAERADLIVDFTNVPIGHHVLANVGPDEPFGGGEPDEDFDAADPDTTGRVLQFRVVAPRSADRTTPPRNLVLPPIDPLPAPTTRRRLALVELMSSVPGHDGPAEAALGVVDDDGMVMHHEWADPITENPAVGATEEWELYNTTADAHPMHIHEVAFEVVDRERLVVEDEEPAQPLELTGDVRGPEPWEAGVKDTVVAYPGEVTRLRMRFDGPGQFVWHCHIVEHEDNEMMRPYRIGPPQPGQPE